MTTLTAFANADATLRNPSASTNYGTLSPSQIGRDNYAGLNRIVINYDLSGLPASAVVSAATCGYTLGSQQGGAWTTTVSAATGSWTELGVTWNNQPGVGTTAFTFDGSAVGTGAKTSTLTTSIAQAWTTPANQLGLIWIGAEGANGKNNTVTAREGSATANFVTITYTTPPTTPGAWTNPTAGQSVVVGAAITLGWGASSAGTFGSFTYTVQLSDSTGSFASPTTLTTGLGTNSYVWTPSMTLTPSAAYMLRVFATDGTLVSGNSDSSAFAIVVPSGSQIVMS